MYSLTHFRVKPWSLKSRGELNLQNRKGQDTEFSTWKGQKKHIGAADIAYTLFNRGEPVIDFWSNPSKFAAKIPKSF